MKLEVIKKEKRERKYINVKETKLSEGFLRGGDVRVLPLRIK